MKIQRQQYTQNFGVIRVPGKANPHISAVVSHFCHRHMVDTVTVNARGKRVQYVETKFGTSLEKHLLAQIRKFKRSVSSITAGKMNAELNPSKKIKQRHYNITQTIIEMLPKN